MRSGILCLLAGLLMAQAAGCGKAKLEVHPVSGRVEFDDRSCPMFGDIEFYNEENRINARGRITREGTFTVGTYSADDGAVEGTHKIVIVQNTTAAVMPYLSKSIRHDHGQLVHPDYFDYRTSDLIWTIVQGENKVVLKLRKHPNQDSQGMPVKPTQ
jgi:hypothetical protein